MPALTSRAILFLPDSSSKFFSLSPSDKQTEGSKWLSEGLRWRSGAWLGDSFAQSPRAPLLTARASHASPREKSILSRQGIGSWCVWGRGGKDPECFSRVLMRRLHHLITVCRLFSLVLLVVRVGQELHIGPRTCAGRFTSSSAVGPLGPTEKRFCPPGSCESSLSPIPLYCLELSPVCVFEGLVVVPEARC